MYKKNARKMLKSHTSTFGRGGGIVPSLRAAGRFQEAARAPTYAAPLWRHNTNIWLSVHPNWSLV